MISLQYSQLVLSILQYIVFGLLIIAMVNEDDSRLTS